MTSTLNMYLNTNDRLVGATVEGVLWEGHVKTVCVFLVLRESLTRLDVLVCFFLGLCEVTCGTPPVLAVAIGIVWH